MAVVKVTVTGLQWQQRCQNVIHFENTDGFLTLDQVIAEIEQNWIQLFRAKQMNSFRWLDISAKTVGDQSQVAHKPIDYFGQAANDPSAQTFSCVKFLIKTAVFGKSGRGRIYVPGMSTVFLWQEGYLNVNAVASMQTLCDQIMARYNLANGTGPLGLGILGKGKPPSAWIPAIGLNVSTTAGVLRRRNIGVGN
jgi:hypothetical protein